ncbi:MAG: hypothetical protein KC636_39615 [Myxococcales bacterium]|nr:hypothetical protein [Myxococcales bacterium]
MTHERDTFGDDLELAALLDDVREHVARARPVPDFAEVVARAHGEDPERINAAMVDEARALASVIPLSAASEPEVPLDPPFAAFVGEVRDAVRDDLAERSLVGIPQVPLPRRPLRAWGWAALAVAAATLLWVFSGDGALLQRLTGTAQPEFYQAPRDQVETLTAGEAELVAPPRVVIPRAPIDASPVEALAEPEPLPPPATELAIEAPVEAKPRAARPSRADRLRALDQEAQALWQQGDLDGAAARFQEIVRTGGKDRRVQHAFGDLFVLTRERGGDEPELWGAYLERFPRGLHADEARAGLCRRADGDARVTCWRAYLEDFPRGAQRKRAERLLAAQAAEAP